MRVVPVTLPSLTTKKYSSMHVSKTQIYCFISSVNTSELAFSC